MKLKLIATLIGLAIAGGAQANIDQSATGNGELFFQVWDDNGTADKTDDRNYVRDLGSLANGAIFGGKLNHWASTAATPVLVADKLVPVAPAIFSISADANMATFLSGTADLSSLRWNITAVDSAGTDRYLTTSKSIVSSQLQTYTEFRGFATQADVFLAKTNSMGSNESIILEGANAGISTFGGNIGGKAKFTTDGAVNDLLNFYLVYEKAATGTGTTFLNQYTDASSKALTWQFTDQGTLIYAPVPEPESYALLLAGLGMIGAIARRRLSKKQ